MLVNNIQYSLELIFNIDLIIFNRKQNIVDLFSNFCQYHKKFSQFSWYIFLIKIFRDSYINTDIVALIINFSH